LFDDPKPALGNHHHLHAKPRHEKVSYLQATFLVSALILLVSQICSGSSDGLVIVFVSIVLEAIPFMMLGSVVGGLIEVFVNRDRLATMLSHNSWLTVFMAAGAGIVFPVCECAIVPVVRRLIGKGLPLGAAVAYLLGGPIVNPIVAASTALAYLDDLRMVVFRLTFGYIIAVTIGLLMGRKFSLSEAIKDNIEGSDMNALVCGCKEHSHDHCNPSEPFNMTQAGSIMRQHSGVAGIESKDDTAETNDWIDKMGSALTHAMEDFLAVAHYLVIGAFIAALAQTHIDRASFLSLSGEPVLAVLLMMALAVMLNLCSEADAFIASSFRGLTPFSAQLSFMLTGPMLDIKLLLMYQNVFSRNTIIFLASHVLLAVLIVTLGLEVLNGIL